MSLDGGGEQSDGGGPPKGKKEDVPYQLRWREVSNPLRRERTTSCTATGMKKLFSSSGCNRTARPGENPKFLLLLKGKGTIRLVQC